MAPLSQVTQQETTSPAPVESFPGPPSRDQVLAVNADFCNLWDSQGRIIFSPFLLTLMDQHDPLADEWFAKFRDAGDTHIVVAVSYDYRSYYIQGRDFHDRMGDFRTYLREIIKRGFIPIIKLGADGQDANPGGGTYGYPWTIAHLHDIIEPLRDLVPYALWDPGWEVAGGGGGDWTGIEVTNFGRALRDALGPLGATGLHLGQGTGYIGNDYDVFLWQPAQPLDQNVSKNTIDGHYLLANSTIPVVVFEFDAFDAFWGGCREDCVRRNAQFFHDLGFTHFGNGQP